MSSYACSSCLLRVIPIPATSSARTKNSCQHPMHEVLRHTCSELIRTSHVVFTSMETVLSWSLLMAFSAAVTVFTISVCFSLSSFCGCKKTKKVRTSTGRIRPAGRCKHSGCLMTTQMLLPVVALPLPHSGSCGYQYVCRLFLKFLGQVQATQISSRSKFRLWENIFAARNDVTGYRAHSLKEATKNSCILTTSPSSRCGFSGISLYSSKAGNVRGNVGQYPLVLYTSIGTSIRMQRLTHATYEVKRCIWFGVLWWLIPPQQRWCFHEFSATSAGVVAAGDGEDTSWTPWMV